MPTLNWIGKEKIVNHDKDVPFRLLRKNKKYSLGKSENLILEGDNLEALKALMPFYYGKIKCIYIDPPYNTGKEKWVYNDKVNAPKIKEWLGRVVGPEGEDLCRHDKWLCMMYPRLKLLRDLLSDDGVIFVSIDNNEVQHLRILMDEIFGEEKFVVTFVWTKKEKASGVPPKNMIIPNFEYILVYKKDRDISFRGQDRSMKSYRKDSGGRFWRLMPIQATGEQNNYFTIINPKNGKRYYGNWAFAEAKVKSLIKDGKIKFPTSNKGKPNRIVYADELKNETSAIFADIGMFDSELSTKEFIRMFGNKKVFEHTKPPDLVKFLFKQATDRKDTIVDSFAGSGTTAHAVLDLNKEDGGNRKFILVELEKNIAKNITAERVKRVARGYSYKTGKGKAVKVPGLGGGFEYVELGEPLFGADGMINPKVRYFELASYIYFTETKMNLEQKHIKKNYLGEHDGRHIFLIFDGIGKNVLNTKAVRNFKTKAGEKIVYADKCVLSDAALARYKIIFKQIPYDVKKTY